MYTYMEAKKKIESGEITSIEILERLENEDIWNKTNFFRKSNNRWEEHTVASHHLGVSNNKFEVSEIYVFKRVNEALTAINYNDGKAGDYIYKINFEEKNKNTSEAEEKEFTLKYAKEEIELEFKRLNNRIDELQLKLMENGTLLNEVIKLNHNLLQIINDNNKLLKDINTNQIKFN